MSMRCPHHNIELKKKYQFRDGLKGAIIFEYLSCIRLSCKRHYEVGGKEIIIDKNKDIYHVLKSGKKALE